MNANITTRHFLRASALAISLSLQAVTNAQTLIEEQPVYRNDERVEISRSPKQSWALAFDNDILVPGSRDQDYTYGLNISFAGDKSTSHWASLHTPLTWLDDALGLSGQEAHKIEYGLFGFTPEDITTATVNDSDRPYASLIYTSSTNEYYNASREVSWSSTLTLGLLGTSIVGYFQEEVHKLTDGDKPVGWDTQISNGGELTARYNLARQGLVARWGSKAEIKNTVQASVGYITETSWSISARFGKIYTPWLSFNPELASYGEKAVPGSNTRLHEHYLWAGFALKARAYNAFLQGQFRDSDVTFDSNEIQHLLVEGWLGYTVALANGYRFTYSLRGHSAEIKRGIGNRHVLWGGLQVAKTFN